MSELIAIAHAHLRNALDFTLLIPARETRHPALLSVGDRSCSAHASKDRRPPGLYERRASEGVAFGGGLDTALHGRRAR